MTVTDIALIFMEIKTALEIEVMSSVIFLKATKRILATAAIVLSAALIAEGGLYILDLHHETGEKLTQNEKTLLKSIFGNKLDTSSIHKQFHSDYKFYGSGGIRFMSVRTASKKHIDIHGAAFASVDYGGEKNTFLYAEFTHEVTHIWQNQQSPARVLNSLKTLYEKARGCPYSYDLTSSSRFTDFCHEQQASIVADYAVRFLHSDGANPETAYYLLTTSHSPLHADPDLLQKIVEEQFPEARKTRLAIEAKERSRGGAPSHTGAKIGAGPQA